MRRSQFLTTIAIGLLVSQVAHSEAQESARPLVAAAPGLFEFHSGFWLDLHHFLYAQARISRGIDTDRPAIAASTRDTAGLGGLDPSARLAWAEAIDFYGRTLARRDATFDSLLIGIKNRLAEWEARPNLTGSGLSPELTAVLERTAPIHRRLWWPAHDAANRAWIAEALPLLRDHGRQIADRLADRFRTRWPERPIRVDLTAYTKGGGAFTTEHPSHITMTSTDPSYRGTAALEMLFHEASHTFEDSLGNTLDAAAGTRRVPYDRTHALIFHTAGQLTRSRIPAHIPYAEATGLRTRSRGMSQQFEAAETAWRPYLEGRLTWDQAIRSLTAEDRLFSFHSNVWINLHHFLYVLSRARQGLDPTRTAVTMSLADTAGQSTLSEEQRRGLETAVAYYGREFANREATFDRAMEGIKAKLIPLDSAGTLDGAGLDAAVAGALTGAMPAYRAAWWARHDRENRAWIARMRPLVALHQDTMAAAVARAFRTVWPSKPVRVDVSAYTNWAGAYTTGPLTNIMISSLAYPELGPSLELLFHEPLHTMDQFLIGALDRAFRAEGKQMPETLSHAFIFYTAGEVTRSRLPGHIPFAESGIWERNRLWGSYLPILRREWQAWLDGRGTFDEAMRAVARRP
ncbi:MAG: hypothetical protein HOP28_14505 [Gemmatimonadales bacterium]|nr:hypothetical protein [Gemmatimonadales bacterium]